MSCIFIDVELTEKNIIKELGLFMDGSPHGFSFCPPKIFKLNQRTTWNTSHLHGIAWSSGKLDYDKFFAVPYDVNVINAEASAKGFKKRCLLTRLFGQNVDILDNYGCPKIHDLVKANSMWICPSYPS